MILKWSLKWFADITNYQSWRIQKFISAQSQQFSFLHAHVLKWSILTVDHLQVFEMVSYFFIFIFHYSIIHSIISSDYYIYNSEVYEIRLENMIYSSYVHFGNDNKLRFLFSFQEKWSETIINCPAVASIIMFEEILGAALNLKLYHLYVRCDVLST